MCVGGGGVSSHNMLDQRDYYNYKESGSIQINISQRKNKSNCPLHFVQGGLLALNEWMDSHP